MADISKITLPNGSEYNIKDQTSRAFLPVSVSVANDGTVVFINSAGNLMMQFQLPVYEVSLNRDGEKLVISPNQPAVMILSSSSWYIDENGNLVMGESANDILVTD